MSERESLRDDARRPVQTSMIAGCERPVGPVPASVIFGDNAALIAAVAPIYLPFPSASGGSWNRLG